MRGPFWILAGALLAGCQSPGERVVARVAGVAITVTEYDSMAARLLAGPFRELQEIDRPAKEKMLQAMIDREVLLLEAERRGMARDPGVVAELRRLEEGLLLKALFATEAAAAAELTDTEVELYFYEGDFDREIRVSSIACATEEDAEEILAALRGGADFTELAASRAQQPPGSRGAGDLGFMPPADLLPEVRAELLSLEPGQYYPEPLQTRYGLQVVMVTDRRSTSLAGREQYMGERLRQERRARRLAAYQDSLAHARGMFCVDAAAAASLDPQQPLCTWDGGSLTGAELAGIQELLGETTGVDTLAVRRLAVRQMLLSEARRRGPGDETLRAQVARKRNELLAARLYAEVVRGIAVTDAEARAYFDAHRDRYGPQPLVEVQEILVTDESLARDLRQRLDEGADMSALAAAHNTRQATRSREGRMQLWRRENAFLGPLAPTALDAEVGSLHGPLEVPGGYSVFRVLSRGELPAPSFGAVQRSIVAVLQQQARAAAMDSLLVGLRTRYADQIEVDAEALASVLQENAGGNHYSPGARPASL